MLAQNRWGLRPSESLFDPLHYRSVYILHLTDHIENTWLFYEYYWCMLAFHSNTYQNVCFHTNLHTNRLNGVRITTHFIHLPFLRDQTYLDNWLLSCSLARCVLFPIFFIYKEQIKGLEFISSVIFAFGICWLSI